MPSASYHSWLNTRVAALDELEYAHQSVGGTARGRRYATQQINQAYAVLLSSQFQGYCRDLHSEAADCLIRSVSPAALQVAVRTAFTQDRKLDRGNPNPGNLGADFGRLGIGFWPRVDALEARSPQRRLLLQELNSWRNAIAHQDFDPVKLGGRTTLLLTQVRRWRVACEALAVSFDEVMRSHILTVTGTSPW